MVPHGAQGGVKRCPESGPVNLAASTSTEHLHYAGQGCPSTRFGASGVPVKGVHQLRAVGPSVHQGCPSTQDCPSTGCINSWRSVKSGHQGCASTHGGRSRGCINFSKVGHVRASTSGSLLRRVYQLRVVGPEGALILGELSGVSSKGVRQLRMFARCVRQACPLCGVGPRRRLQRLFLVYYYN